MSKCLDLLIAGGVALALAAGVVAPAPAQTHGLGRAALPEEVAAWDIDVRPDGLGLPDGRGTVSDGESVFAEKCAVCHGDFAEGVDRWPVLAGGQDTLTEERPVKTIGSYWPYLSTVWDYVNRAMPFGDAQSLTADEVYGITAYLLYANDLVDEEFELSRANFADVRLPNEDGFFADDRLQSPVWTRRDRCMTDCKPAVTITGRARILDVTPDDTTDDGTTDDGTTDDGTTDDGQAAAAEPAPVSEPVPEPAAELAIDPALAAAGEKVFRKCKACHAVGDGARHKVGPHLNGVFGRTAGAVDGFSKFSKGMIKAGADGMVWDDETLAAYLARPRAVIKGTRMAFAGLKKPDDIAAVLAYLKQAGL